ncbi:MAG: aminotransferase class I/II-fold pyridoxal phosphate-dependent enzyme [Flavobacteriales bacterium]|jgi:8-amino-7-oxononanoate synthase|nr:aminotransferase class I/II-fold pyridoxal phosphate-dependent enzyme [Flavobacteriales bacterium]
MHKSHHQEALEKRKKLGGFRSLTLQDKRLDFTSNDYLSLQKNQDWKQFLRSHINDKLIWESSCSSRLISGESEIKKNAEDYFSSFYGSDTALFFNSGYTANIGVISSLAHRNDTLIYDQLSHASIREGIQLSPAKSYGFKHNDLTDLEKKLKIGKGQKYVIVESVYSMDGDLAPLEKILKLCNQYQAYLIVDEAHSSGIFGFEGQGLCFELGIHHQVFARIMTFGKGVSASGAVVLSSRVFRSYLINFSRAFIYTTAPSDFMVLKAQKSVEFIAQNPQLIHLLKEKIQFLQDLFKKNLGIHLKQESPIFPLLFQNNQKIAQFEEALEKQDFALKKILPPTVPEGSERLRISLQAHHEYQDLESLIRFLGNFSEMWRLS